MIVQKTTQTIRHDELIKLIGVLEPIAAKYKAPRMAKEALQAIGWSYGTMAGMDGATRFYKRIQTQKPDTYQRGYFETEFFEVYEYGKGFSTLPEMVEMLKRQEQRYAPTIEPAVTAYVGDLRTYINYNFKKEMTAADFKLMKLQMVEQLKAAIAFVEGSEAPQECSYGMLEGEQAE